MAGNNNNKKQLKTDSAIYPLNLQIISSLHEEDTVPIISRGWTKSVQVSY